MSRCCSMSRACHFPHRARSDTLAALEELAKDAAALIVEPLILGSGGMHDL